VLGNSYSLNQARKARFGPPLAATDREDYAYDKLARVAHLAQTIERSYFG
jgi:hypothetical protein